MIRAFLIAISLFAAAPAFAQGALTFTGANSASACQYNLNLPTIGSGTARLPQCDANAVLLYDLSKINGNAILTGAGAVGSGSQRITVGQDTSTVAGSAPGTAGSASLNVLTIQGIASMTPVQVSQATASNLNATVVGTGTFAVQASQSGTWTVQPGNSANSTPWLVTGSGTAGSAASGVFSVQGIASMTPLLVNPGTEADFAIGATGSSVPANAAYDGINVSGNLRGWTGVNPSGSIYAGQVDLASVAGTTAVTAASGVLQVGVVGNAGAKFDQATGSAVPANALYMGASSGGDLVGVVTCGSHVFKHITTATDTNLVAGVSSQVIKVCGASFNFSGSAAQSAYLEDSNNQSTTCSSLTQIGGLITGNSSSPSAAGFYNAIWGGLATSSGYNLCVNTSSTGGVDVDVWYTQGS